MTIYSAVCAFLKNKSLSLTIVISCLALLLGGINFYWTFLKGRKVLHLVYVAKVGNMMKPEFAIVNGGKKDILITNLSCSFGNIGATGSAFTPAQRVEFKESDSNLLSAGKGFHCKVAFTEQFTSSFVKSGKPKTTKNRQLYMHDMYVDISWVELDGITYDKSVKLVKCDFNEKGEIVYRAPIRRPIDLYE